MDYKVKQNFSIQTKNTFMCFQNRQKCAKLIEVEDRVK